MDARAIAMGLAFALIWSSAFTSARIIVSEAPPLLASSLRFMISGLIGIALARLMGQNMRLTRAQWRATLVFGICQNALYLGLFFVAMQWIEASLAAIIASSMPLLVALLGWLALGERTRPIGVVGLLAGLGGVVLIMGSRLSGGVDPLGVAICVIGVLALAVATLSVRGASSGGNVMMIVGLQMLVGSLCMLPFGLWLESAAVTLSPRLLVAFSYTVLGPGLLATFIWFMLVNRIGAVRAATFHFLNPFFGIAIAALLLDEDLRSIDMIGVAVIMAGILAVQLSKQAPR